MWFARYYHFKLIRFRTQSELKLSNNCGVINAMSVTLTAVVTYWTRYSTHAWRIRTSQYITYVSNGVRTHYIVVYICKYDFHFHNYRNKDRPLSTWTITCQLRTKLLKVKRYKLYENLCLRVVLHGSIKREMTLAYWICKSRWSSTVIILKTLERYFPKKTNW